MAETQSEKPLNQLTVVGEKSQGVAKTPRILVVEENNPFKTALQTSYKNHPEFFHGCELVFADTTDYKKNAAFAIDPLNGIDGVVTGLSSRSRYDGVKDSFYGLKLAEMLQGDKPVIVTSLNESVEKSFAQMTPEQLARLTETQRMLQNAGVIGVYAKDNFDVYKILADKINGRETMRSV